MFDSICKQYYLQHFTCGTSASNRSSHLPTRLADRWQRHGSTLADSTTAPFSAKGARLRGSKMNGGDGYLSAYFSTWLDQFRHL